MRVTLSVKYLLLIGKAAMQRVLLTLYWLETALRRCRLWGEEVRQKEKDLSGVAQTQRQFSTESIINSASIYPRVNHSLQLYPLCLCLPPSLVPPVNLGRLHMPDDWHCCCRCVLPWHPSPIPVAKLICWYWPAQLQHNAASNGVIAACLWGLGRRQKCPALLAVLVLMDI